jgi:restriction endonuclease Mrr
MQLVDAGTDSTSRGILLTTSTFSSGAVLAAKELSIELIDGAHLASLIAACETSVT